MLHEKYDLKGSTRNRWCTPRFGAVLKDLNFGTNKLYLDKDDRDAFLAQCEKDTLLLEQFNVMDYSLLLGIHKADAEKGGRNLVLLAMANQLEQVHVKPNRWQRDFGGVEGWNKETNTPEVYIMCVIDLLQAYDFGKKAENLIKSQMTEVVSEISSVNPKTYRTRFLHYMGKITVGTEGQNARIAAQRREIKLQVFANNSVEVTGGRPTTWGGRNNTNLRGSVMVPSGMQTKPPPPPPMSPSPALVDPTPTPVPLLPPSPLKEEPTVFAMAAAEEKAEGVSSFVQALLDEGALDDVADGTLDEKELVKEIQRALEEAAEVKNQVEQSGGAAAYTETLDDGTEITILENGGYIQRAPNGTEIHMFPDGSKKQTDPDGSTILVSPTGAVTCFLPDGTEILQNSDEFDEDIEDVQKNPDGSIIELWKDGTQIQRNVDGSRIETYSNGDKRTFFADGTIVEQMGSGAKRQINPDGITILSMTNGMRIQTDEKNPHQILTIYPDGMTVQEDKSDGMVIKTFPDKSEHQTFPDGTIIEYQPSGYSKQTNKDGTVIETFPDGRIVQTNADGKVLERRVGD